MKSFYLKLSLIFMSISSSILGDTLSDLIWNKELYYKKVLMLNYYSYVKKYD